MGKQCEGCVYYKSLGVCGEGTERACHYLLIRGKMRERDEGGCRSREGKKRREKIGGGRDAGYRTSGPNVPGLRRG